MRNAASTALTLATLALAAGCTSTSPFGSGSTSPVPDSATPPVGGVCNAQPAQGFVGQMSTAKVVEAARVSSGANMARVLRPGQMITKEYDTQRLNLQIDATGRITSVNCG
ncbi:I78 family peptidase inhibitor [Paracidovorax wautersii]|uniref:I78 family peptidase inhibitor n=1 Tax=Paracidovorax wautersii TaxID=1177982 RepID=UPI0031DAE1C0